jgi:hypothetical protein
LYLYGGVSSPEGTLLDELWTIDTSAVNWNSKTIELPGVIYDKHILADGQDREQMPGSLRGHSTVSFLGNMIIIGGVKADS